ncbi:hypothetical protein [Paraflavitalea speifideaquila]|uniref:hypothetical protein n=1 Tax=Paraflavitalea speifideaquila TaxID=3076558 RepID=UPI0028EBAE54|nr:hypothetical protein [Paraflavitalea speifideiaquila]
MRIIKKLLLAAVLFYLPCQTMAWGMLGHRIVAQIADSYLTKKPAGRSLPSWAMNRWP